MSTLSTTGSGYTVNTVTYSQAGDLPLLADVYTATTLPSASSPPSTPQPVLLYFHGGSLVVGDRKSFMPEWLIQPLVVQRGWTFISFDYRLLPESTLENINADLLATEQFAVKQLNSILASMHLPAVDLARVVVGGASAGGYLALQAGHLFTQLKPRVLAAVYPMTFADPSWYMQPRPEPAASIAAVGTQPDESSIDRLLTSPGAPISGFPLITFSQPHPRLWLARLLFGRGQYWRTAFGSDTLPADMPASKQRLLPALNVSALYPPTVMIHGTADSTITVRESELMIAVLAEAGVDHLFVPVAGKQHGFDIAQTSDAVVEEQSFVNFVLAHIS